MFNCERLIDDFGEFFGARRAFECSDFLLMGLLLNGSLVSFECLDEYHTGVLSLTENRE